MSILLGILLTLLILLIVVMVHEFGHFITARITGMKVEEFGIGIPPKMTSIATDKHGTEYTFNWLPIGGFVRILWENPWDIESYNKWAFITKPWISRVIVLIAGVAMNFLLAFLIYTGLFIYGISPMTIIPMENMQSRILPSAHEAIESGFLTHSGIIITPLSGSVASRVWLKDWDQIAFINGIVPQLTQDIIDIIKKNKEIELQIVWKDKPIKISPIDGKIGVTIQYKNINFNSNKIIKFGWQDAVLAWSQETIATTKITFAFLTRMIGWIFTPKTEKEHEEAKNMLSGPIWLGWTFVSIVEKNVPLTIVLIMVALLSINLWVVNIIPFPALDWWRIVTTTLYSIFSYLPKWKKYFSKFEWGLHAIGFLVLIMVMLYVSGLDILRFF